MVRSVVVDPAVLQRLLELHARAGADEPCALLLGTWDEGQVRVEDAVVTENVHPRPAVAFSTSARSLVEASRRAREAGCSVVGAWHGHGPGPADLSRADATALLGAAVAPGSEGVARPVPFAYLVSGRGAGRATVLRGFVAEGGRIAERPVVARSRPSDARSA